MTINNWPLQANCDTFYGNPRGHNGNVNPVWEAQNLVEVSTPWKLYFEDTPVPSFKVHKKVADSLKRVFAAIWSAAGQDQAVVTQWGMAAFSGSFNFRVKRGGSTLSMHAYGCAVDFDAPHNGFGDANGHFKHELAVLKAWADEGWVWGGVWSKPDPMHWQAARVR